MVRTTTLLWDPLVSLGTLLGRRVLQAIPQGPSFKFSKSPPSSSQLKPGSSVMDGAPQPLKAPPKPSLSTGSMAAFMRRETI